MSLLHVADLAAFQSSFSHWETMIFIILSSVFAIWFSLLGSIKTFHTSPVHLNKLQQCEGVCVIVQSAVELVTGCIKVVNFHSCKEFVLKTTYNWSSKLFFPRRLSNKYLRSEIIIRVFNMNCFSAARHRDLLFCSSLLKIHNHLVLSHLH